MSDLFIHMSGIPVTFYAVTLATNFLIALAVSMWQLADADTTI